MTEKNFFIVKVYVNGIKRLISQAILDADVRDLLFYGPKALYLQQSFNLFNLF